MEPRDVPAEPPMCACGACFRLEDARCAACDRLLCEACPQRECDECRDVHCSNCLFAVTRQGKALKMCQACIEREREELDV